MAEVAPHAGAWIEIDVEYRDSDGAAVAPHAGAWIEIMRYPSGTAPPVLVAPHAGAWIEIIIKPPLSAFKRCRSPRGSVD